MKRKKTTLMNVIAFILSLIVMFFWGFFLLLIAYIATHAKSYG